MIFNKILSKFTSNELIKLNTVKDNANKYILPEASTTKLGGIKASAIEEKNSSGELAKLIGYSNSILSIDKTKFLNFLNFSSIENSNSSTNNTQYLTSNLTWNYPKKLEYKGMAMNSGSWSITGLIVYQPLFILRHSTSVVNTANACVRVISGAIGGRVSTYMMGVASAKSGDVFITIPTSTTVVIRCDGCNDDEEVYAYQ